MATELEFVATLFGDRAMVAGLSALNHQIRYNVYSEFELAAEAYARDVATSGLAEQGIVSRSGRLAGNMAVRGRLTPSSVRVLVYPGASDPKTKYRYPWALGRGSPKHETEVREYLLGVPAGAKKTRARGKRGVTHRYTARAQTALVRAGARVVKGHHRKVNLRARPFMSGGALTRLQAGFVKKIEAAMAKAISDARAEAAADAGNFDGLGVS